MIREKYAIRFPGIQNIDKNPTTSLFSAKAITTATDTFHKTFDALGSLTGLVLQKARTHELSKQLNIQRTAIDEIVEDQKEQKKIEFEEYTKRLQVKLESEQKKMELEMKEMAFEVREKISRFSISFEEGMKSNQILLKIIRSEENFLNDTCPYIELLAEDYSQRREYVLYCEMQRKSFELVNLYLREML